MSLLTQKLQDITSTIQREQNEIIRDTASHVLIVEGIAGSGKTSTILHESLIYSTVIGMICCRSKFYFCRLTRCLANISKKSYQVLVKKIRVK